MMDQLIEQLTQTTAVGRSRDDLVKVKIDAGGRPLGFKLAANHPKLSPEETLSLAIQALRDAHETLASHTSAHLADTAVGAADDEARTNTATVRTDMSQQFEELRRYSEDVRGQLDRTMGRLGRLLG